jgi:hypothetical protein
VPLILASPGFGANDVIVVLYDEDERAGGMAAKNGLGQGGHTVCAILGPSVVAGDYGDTTYHYSLLRTFEDGFGIPSYLGHAAEVAPLTAIWSARPH